jgi:hypothetical protein
VCPFYLFIFSIQYGKRGRLQQKENKQRDEHLNNNLKTTTTIKKKILKTIGIGQKNGPIHRIGC